MEGRNYEMLMKSNWFASDIKEYLGCSLEYAKQIKAKTEEEYGAVILDVNKKERSVAADDVLKVIGGKDRLTESEIYRNLRSDEKNG